MSGTVKVGIIGSQFQAECHCASIQQLGEAIEVVAIASRRPATPSASRSATGCRAGTPTTTSCCADPDIELVTITAPNRQHCGLTLDIARAGKHVVCEKPFCMTMEEADLMIDTCREQGVLLMYAEELFFTPKYVKAKHMADQGAFGDVYLVKQSEKHFGPHADWFWDVEQSGGGALMDLGCHGIAFANWFLDRPELVSVTAQLGTYVHQDRTRADDNAFVILEFAGGKVALVEDSWARQGGMDDRIEVFGSGGHVSANLLRATR